MIMRYAYPVRLTPIEDGYFLVKFRDVPDLTTQGANRAAALSMAVDALSTNLWFRLRDGEAIPVPSRARKGEVLVEPEPGIVLKLALGRAAGGTRGAAARIARALDINHKEARRLLDPTKANKADRLTRALELFGHRVSVSIARRASARSDARPARVSNRSRHV